MTSTESSQRHQDHQQFHNINWLMMVVVEDSEDEAVVEALALAMDRLFSKTMEL